MTFQIFAEITGTKYVIDTQADQPMYQLFNSISAKKKGLPDDFTLVTNNDIITRYERKKVGDYLEPQSTVLVNLGLRGGGKQSKLKYKPSKRQEKRKLDRKTYYKLSMNIFNKYPHLRPDDLKSWKTKGSNLEYWRSVFDSVRREEKRLSHSQSMANERAALAKFYKNPHPRSKLVIKKLGFAEVVNTAVVHKGFLLVFEIKKRRILLSGNHELDKIKKMVCELFIDNESVTGSDSVVIMNAINDPNTEVKLTYYRLDKTRHSGAFFPYTHKMPKVDLTKFGIFNELPKRPLINPLFLHKHMVKYVKGDMNKLKGNGECLRDFNKHTVSFYDMFDFNKLKFIATHLRQIREHPKNKQLFERQRTKKAQQHQEEYLRLLGIQEKSGMVIRYYNKVIKFQERYKKSCSIIPVTYNRKAKSDYHGRFYAENGLSLIGLNRCVRQTITKGLMDDVDISNCYPCVYLYLSSKWKLDTPALRQYVMNRKQVIREIMEMNNMMTDDKIKFLANRSIIKTKFLAMVFGGKAKELDLSLIHI